MLKRAVLGISLVLILAILTFYFTASSETITREDWHEIRHFESPVVIPSDTLRVMTYNLGYLSGMTNNLGVSREKSLFDGNMEKAHQLINNIRPHLIGFQEIDYGAKRSFHVQQLEQLVTANDFSIALQSINWDKRYVPFPYWPPEFHFGKILSGEAILAQGELAMDQVLTLPKPVNAPFYYNAFYLDRLVQIADWQIGGQNIKVMNLHLEAFDEETRLIHAKEALELYERYAAQHPVILMGDFNSVPAILEGTDGMDIIMAADNIASSIPDSTYSSNPSDYFTFSSGEPFVMIDYILYNPSHIIPISARVVKEAGEISDHLPVLFEFRLK